MLFKKNFKKKIKKKTMTERSTKTSHELLQEMQERAKKCNEIPNTLQGLLQKVSMITSKEETDLIKDFQKAVDLDFKKITYSCQLWKMEGKIACSGCGFAVGKQKCSGCKYDRYCSIECQKKHWEKHKLDCKKRKEEMEKEKEDAAKEDDVESPGNLTK